MHVTVCSYVYNIVKKTSDNFFFFFCLHALQKLSDNFCIVMEKEWEIYTGLLKLFSNRFSIL